MTLNELRRVLACARYTVRIIHGDPQEYDVIDVDYMGEADALITACKLLDFEGEARVERVSYSAILGRIEILCSEETEG